MPATVLVTGATGGFGAAIARRYAALGYKLVLHARNRDKLDALVDSLDGADIIPVLFDMGDRDAMRASLDVLPAIDVLVNNAGLALGLVPAHEADLADWDEMIATNVTALVHMTRWILPGMVARKRGHIINIGSVAGRYPYPGSNVYGATKAFVQQFSLNLRADLHGTNVRVTTIEPGLAETNFSVARFRGDRERAAAVYRNTHPLTGEDIAEAVLWVSTLPDHVNINTMEIMPTDQSFGGLQIHREKTA